jgi:predicted transcriptional regulator
LGTRVHFSELKKREEKQLKHIKKIIDEFRVHLVEFKKNSSDPDDYQNAERSNQKMKALSSDLHILLSLLEFEDQSLQNVLGFELYEWIDFVLKWKIYS